MTFAWRLALTLFLTGSNRSSERHPLIAHHFVDWCDLHRCASRSSDCCALSISNLERGFSPSSSSLIFFLVLLSCRCVWTMDRPSSHQHRARSVKKMIFLYVFSFTRVGWSQAQCERCGYPFCGIFLLRFINMTNLLEFVMIQETHYIELLMRQYHARISFFL